MDQLSTEPENQTNPKSSPEMPSVDEHMVECITHCLNCSKACYEELYQCLLRGREYTNAAHIQLLQTCASLCQVHAQFMMLHSPYHARLGAVCASVCEACAESCENYDDPLSQKCAEICRKCSQSCEEISMLTN